MGLLFTLFVILVVFSLFRGDGLDSMLDIKRCSGVDWVLFASFQFVCLMFFALGVWVVKIEYEQKVKWNYTFTKGEM